MKSDEYREGYSLESLRDLEQVPLTTEAAQNGYFIDHTLRKLFKLVNDGFKPQQQALVFKEGTARLVASAPADAESDWTSTASSQHAHGGD